MEGTHLLQFRNDPGREHQHVSTAVDQCSRAAFPGYAEQQRSPAPAGDRYADAGAEKGRRLY